MRDKNSDLSKGSPHRCAYCGATPTWPVEWARNGEDIEVVWLCEACDDRESEELDRELSGD